MDNSEQKITDAEQKRIEHLNKPPRQPLETVSGLVYALDKILTSAPFLAQIMLSNLRQKIDTISRDEDSLMLKFKDGTWIGLKIDS